MSEISKDISNLSPEKRELLDLLLEEEGIKVDSALILPQERHWNQELGGYQMPMSFAQQRLWFLNQFSPDSPLYNLPTAIRLEGDMEVELFEKSINAIISKHETLRTGFNDISGEGYQIIYPELAYSLPIIDLSSYSENDKTNRVEQIITDEAQTPFNLSEAPLYRIKLLKLNPNEHIFLLVMHHILSDGWSMGVLLRETVQVYHDLQNGKPISLGALSIQYADYAFWQQNWLRGDVLDKQLDYWKTHLGDQHPILALPTDHPRPALRKGRGGSYYFEFPEAIGSAIRRLSDKEGVTLFIALLTAFFALLYRYTNQEEIRVGTPIAGRTRKEVEGLIGFFVNTLVIQADISGNPTFKELLTRVREVAVGAYSHQDLPFETLVQELQPDRDMSIPPLFQVMFSLQNAPGEVWKLPGLKVSNVVVHSATAKFDLSIILFENVSSETGSTLGGIVEYDLDLFEASSIERMMNHYRVLLERVTNNPDKPIMEQPLMMEEELSQLLVDWNNNIDQYPFGKSPRTECIHQIFETQVERTPDHIAAVYKGEEITFEVLNQKANQVAWYLRERGVGPDTLVGLCVERSINQLVGLFAILKAGGAYVPLDPAYPVDRLAYMIEDAGLQLLVTHESVLVQLQEIDLDDQTKDHILMKNVCLDKDWEQYFSSQSEGNLPNVTKSENLAYVIYTSGSTGKPKGVMIEHRSVVNLFYGLSKIIYSHDGIDFLPSNGQTNLKLSLNAPLSFDASVQQWVMLLSGHTIFILPQDVRLDGDLLIEFIRANELDILDCVPSQLKLLLGSGLLDQDHWIPQAILPGGEAIDLETWQKLSQFRDVKFFNMYGPTECAVDSTICQVDQFPSKPSIGKPNLNAVHFILDTNLQPVPIGVPGELYIGGEGVSRGYHNRPELTAERFIPNPFVDLFLEGKHSLIDTFPSIDRIYRTGDLVRYLPEGYIEFLGRTDFQVKVRGFRIELGEIEAVLKSNQKLTDAVVIAREDSPGVQQLVAYVIPEYIENDGTDALTITGAGATKLGVDMREFLAEILPDYMVPSAFVVMKEYPLTPNAKINRAALPVPGREHLHTRSRYVLPRTLEEQILADIWSQILGISQLGIFDNFFDLGGHSLLATKVLSRSRKEFDLDIPLRTIFDSPTIAQFAKRIETIRREKSGLALPPIKPIPRDQELTLSFGQQRLWFIDQLEPGSALYNIPEAIRVRGALNVDALETSMNVIIHRHEVLRSSFTEVEGRASVRIYPEIRIKIPVEDLSSLAKDTRELEVHEAVIYESRLPFDLSIAPLLRVKVLKLTDNDWIVLFTMHHIVSDGWSSSVLVNELATLYPATTGGATWQELINLLPELNIQYVDYASWQRDWISSEILDKQLNYWKEKLADLSPLLKLPTDRPRPAVQSSSGGHESFAIPTDLYQSFAAVSQESGSTLFMTMLATFQALLYRFTGSDDIPVGTPIANRNQTEIEELIGFFVNTLVISANFSENPTFLELVNQVRDAGLDAYMHQDVPFEMLVDQIQPNRNLSYSPLFQVMFVLHNVEQDKTNFDGLFLQRVEIDSGISKFDLTMVMSEDQDCIHVGIEYNTDLFDRSTILRLISHYQQLLESIVQHPDQPISSLQIINQVDLEKMLVEWNDTDLILPSSDCVHEIFEKQVLETPHAISAVYQGKQLTLLEVNQRANQLAHYIQKLGIGPEKIVAICIEQSFDLPIGLMGILKSGGAYLPLDPMIPSERLEYIVEDAGVDLILTQEPLLHKFDGYDTTVICLDADRDKISNEPVENLIGLAGPENLAYVIYTSGSTGKPKGVMLRHLGLINITWWAVKDLEYRSDSKALRFFNYSFDGSILDIFPPLILGAKIVIPDRDTRYSMDDLHRFIQGNEITHLLMTPTSFSILPSEYLSSLKTCMAGGEALPPEIAARWLSDDRRLINAYGPTETTVAATYYVIEDIYKNEDNVPIGRPIANYQIYILDKYAQPVPIGVLGELYIGGVGVARGYINNSRMTAELFIPDPFSNIPGSRLYKTGDLVRFMPDGNVKFLGRIDQQVKIRGFRIELGEIENVLLTNPSVLSAVVLAREDAPGFKRLVAYIVPEPEHDINIGEIKDFVQAELPEYMIPGIYVTLEQMPLTSTGKIDRNALPEPEVTRLEGGAEFVAPSTQDEKTIAEIWSELMGIKEISINDNFFELGGDSILTVQVIAKAKQHGLHLTPRQLFEYPTIAGLAREAKHGVVIEAEQGIVEGEVVLTPIQQWFFEQAIPNRNYYNQALLFEVKRDIDTEALLIAVEALLLHHDGLRLRFKISNGDVIQTNHGHELGMAGASFIRVDLTATSSADLDHEISSRAEEIQSSLDIDNGPVFKIALFELGNSQSSRLLICAHHLVIDGISWRILLEDMQSAYQQASRGSDVKLPDKTTSFKAWADKLSEYANSERVQDELPFWLGLLKTGNTDLPIDYPGGNNLEDLFTGISTTLSEEETTQLLKDVPGAYHTEINDILLTALVLTIADWTGNKSALISMESHGREDLFDDVDISRTVGWFTSMYPVILSVDLPWDIGETIKSIKEQLRAIPKNGIGYGLLKYLAEDGIRRQMAEIPDAEISFNYLGQFDQVLPDSSLLKLAKESRGSDRDGGGTQSILLDISGGILKGRLTLEWKFSVEIFDTTTIEEFAENYNKHLRKIIEHCTSAHAEGFTPSDFPLADIDQKELDKLLGKLKG